MHKNQIWDDILGSDSMKMEGKAPTKSRGVAVKKQEKTILKPLEMQCIHVNYHHKNLIHPGEDRIYVITTNL